MDIRQGNESGGPRTPLRSLDGKGIAFDAMAVLE